MQSTRHVTEPHPHRDTAKANQRAAGPLPSDRPDELLTPQYPLCLPSSQRQSICNPHPATPAPRSDTTSRLQHSQRQSIGGPPLHSTAATDSLARTPSEQHPSVPPGCPVKSSQQPRHWSPTDRPTAGGPPILVPSLPTETSLNPTENTNTQRCPPCARSLPSGRPAP